MVRAAAGFVVRNGPTTSQDRWEENAGYTPFTLAAEVAGLLAAADLAELCASDATGGGASDAMGVDLAGFLRDTADAWETEIEDWIYVTDTTLAREAGVAGYYVRIAPPVPGEARAAPHATVAVRNRTIGSAEVPAESLVSTDALALVRFGLRAPDDPRIVDTVRVIDRVLRQDLPNGPGWRRYNGDGYGEHDDGSPFDGTGTGRVWPLLAGERAHYELAAGRGAEARRLLATLEANASPGKLLPEQVWDGPPIPQRELLPGAPSGSAMPLAWAHAEHLKLLRSLADGVMFDLPPQPVRRYQHNRQAPRVRPWRPDWRTPRIPAGRVLRIELPQPSVVAWSMDAGRTHNETPTRDTGLGVHVVELPAAQALDSIAFTWRGAAADARNGETFVVAVG